MSIGHADGLPMPIPTGMMDVFPRGPAGAVNNRKAAANLMTPAQLAGSRP
jgi:hypothetical protein